MDRGFDPSVRPDIRMELTAGRDAQRRLGGGERVSRTHAIPRCAEGEWVRLGPAWVSGPALCKLADWGELTAAMGRYDLFLPQPTVEPSHREYPRSSPSNSSLDLTLGFVSDTAQHALTAGPPHRPLPRIHPLAHAPLPGPLQRVLLPRAPAQRLRWPLCAPRQGRRPRVRHGRHGGGVLR